MMGCLGANLTALHTQALSPRILTAPETRPKKTVKKSTLHPAFLCTGSVCSLPKTQARKMPHRSIKVGFAEPIAQPILAHPFLHLSQWYSQKVWHLLKPKRSFMSAAGQPWFTEGFLLVQKNQGALVKSVWVAFYLHFILGF